jgi:hypothetical protein
MDVDSESDEDDFIDDDEDDRPKKGRKASPSSFRFEIIVI